MSLNARLESEQPQPLGRSAVDAIRELIVTGSVSEGDHLRETELAARLGVSRGPIREAFVQLEHEGFVELRRHRGAFVTTLRRRDVEEVYSLRLALERLAMQRASTRMSPDLLARLDAVLAEMQEVDSAASAPEVVELDLRFHDLVYEAADHDRLERSWRFIRNQVAFFLQVRNRAHPDFPEVGYAEHRDLRDVLAAGDPEWAAAAIVDHVRGTLVRLLADLDGSGPPPERDPAG